jgi:ATP-dependent helicase HrpA
MFEAMKNTKSSNRADVPENFCLTSDVKRLRALQRDLLRSTGEKREKLQADLAALVERSRAAVLARQARLPKPEYQEDLPVNERRGEIAELIAKNQVVIVCGETGSGKTTQIAGSS